MTAGPVTARRPFWRDPVVAAGVAVILIIQAIVIWQALPRALDHDEGEHLRASAWIASGKTLYRDFAENHTPFLYMILSPLAPPASAGIGATRHYAMEARALSAMAGVCAILCIAAIASHLAGDAIAILAVLVALMATSWLWLRGLADVRSEPYTLLLFWAGALLVVKASSGSRRAIVAAGTGIGLIAVADLWNPKWPLESLVFLGLYVLSLWRARTGVPEPASSDDSGVAGDEPGVSRRRSRREIRSPRLQPGGAGASDVMEPASAGDREVSVLDGSPRFPILSPATRAGEFGMLDAPQLKPRATDLTPASPAKPTSASPNVRNTWSRNHILASLAIAVALPLIALGIALRLTTLRDLFFFSFTYSSAVSRWYRGAVAATSASGFAFCPPWLLPWAAAIAAVIAAWRRRAVMLLLLLVASATAEVILLYPYPHLWPQYLVMWACVVALLWGAAVPVIGTRSGVRAIVVAVTVIGFAAHEWPYMTHGTGDQHWRTMLRVQRRLGPGEAAWVRPEELPTAVPAGSYYWYAFTDQVPFTIAYARTASARGFFPSLNDDDLPPCRIARGIDTMHVRLIDLRAVDNLPASKRCMEELLRRGALRAIDGTPIFEVVR